MENINERFKKLRKKCNKTQTEWGKILGITASGVSDIESGRRSVTEQHLIMLKNWKEKPINIDYLRDGSGEMFLEMTPIEKAYSEFGDIMENASPTKVATLTMLIEMIKRLPDDEWDYIMNQYNEALKEAKK